MATSLLYLGPYLGLCSILGTAGLGSICIHSYCSCCGYYSWGLGGVAGVAGAAIRVAGGAAIRTTSSTAIGIAGGISRAASSKVNCGRVDCGKVDYGKVDYSKVYYY